MKNKTKAFFLFYCCRRKFLFSVDLIFFSLGFFPTTHKTNNYTMEIRREELNMLYKPVLRAMCTERGLAVGGKNEDLVNRILVHEGHARPEGDLRFMSKNEIAALPDETILTSLEAFGDNQLSRVPHKRKTREFMTKACEKDPKALKHCPKLGDDADFVSKLIEDGTPEAYQYCSLAKRADPALAVKAITKNPSMFLSAPDTLRHDAGFVLPLLALPSAGDAENSYGDLFVYAGRQIQRTPKACLLAAKNCSKNRAHLVMLNMCGEGRQSEAVMRQLIKKNPELMLGAAANLKESLPFAVRAVALNGRVLPYLDKRWQDSLSVVATALVQCPEVVVHTAHSAASYLQYYQSEERNYETSKRNVFQFLCMLARPTAEGGEFAPVACLSGQTRVKVTIASYLMKVTTHPIQNAMTANERAKLRKAVQQLGRAAEIQEAALGSV